jgi:hypothetical protein
MINPYKENMSPFYQLLYVLTMRSPYRGRFLTAYDYKVGFNHTNTLKVVIKQQNAQIPIHNYQQTVTLIRSYKHTNFIRK